MKGAGDLLGIAIAAVFFGWMFWAAWKRGRLKPTQVLDGDPSAGYKVYSTEFDVVIHGDEIKNRLISVSPDYAKGHFLLSRDRWNAQCEAARTLVGEEDQNESFTANRASLNDFAITFLVDQSGSMKGAPMAWIAASLRQTSVDLCRAGAAVEIIGYTTGGWHGGFARLKWISKGRPKRPGRLCALLHIVYKEFGEQEWSEDSWCSMLQPDILRENVDGESLLWASERLSQRTEKHKALIVVSDGAPVDDSNLTENGPSYLWWHWQKVVTELDARPDMELMAIGVDYRVEEIYKRSIKLSVGDNFQRTVWDLVQRPT